MSDILPPLALRDNTLDLVETAIRTRRTILDDIAPHFAGATTAAGLGRPSLDGTIMPEASRGGLAFS